MLYCFEFHIILNSASSAFILEIHVNVSSNLLFHLEELLYKMVLCRKWCVLKFLYTLVKNKDWKYTVEELPSVGNFLLYI